MSLPIALYTDLILFNNMALYKIEWEKYLVDKRGRNSTRKNNTNNVVDPRNPFESDLGRVAFSIATRRMHDKTQVIPLTTGDCVHTRLTHSIEVMNVAESLCMNLCRTEDFINNYGDKAAEYEKKISAILRTAALIHDIGNPPFGHFGEETIQNFFKSESGSKYVKGLDNSKIPDFTEFDGNAQGLRVLTKLQYLGDLSGLNLTYGTLAAFIKYPNYGPKESKEETYIGKKKHGVFFSEHDLLDKIVAECSLNTESGITKRHPLVFLVEAADSICYDIMDIEDALSMDWIHFNEFEKKLGEMAYEISKEKGSISDDDPNRKEMFIDISNIINFKYSNAISMKKNIVNFRVAIIGYLINVAVETFKDNLEAIDKGTYSKELLDGDKYHIGDALSKYARTYVFSKKEISSLELTGEAVITGLLNLVLRCVFSENSQYRKRIKSVISNNCLCLNIHENSQANNSIKFNPLQENLDFDLKEMDTYNKLKLVVDWISGMTDKYALEVYQQLSGSLL